MTGHSSQKTTGVLQENGEQQKIRRANEGGGPVVKDAVAEALEKAGLYRRPPLVRSERITAGKGL